MEIQLADTVRSFKPRPSYGWCWLILLAVIIGALGIAPALALGIDSTNARITLLISVPVTVAFLILAFWFPTMRYELSREAIILRYGPVITYRILLKEIRTIRRKNLTMTIWSSIRFPGIALFKIPYGNAGEVKMCATSALNNILLIETEKEKYGLTPDNEEEFVAAVRAQMEV